MHHKSNYLDPSLENSALFHFCSITVGVVVLELLKENSPAAKKQNVAQSGLPAVAIAKCGPVP